MNHKRVANIEVWIKEELKFCDHKYSDGTSAIYPRDGMFSASCDRCFLGVPDSEAA